MKIDGVLLSILFLFVLSTATFATFDGGSHLDDPFAPEYILSHSLDTVPLRDRQGDFINNPNNNPFDLNDPSVIQKEVEYDPASGQYIITERIGSEYFRMPTYMTFEEYLEWKSEKEEREYFQQISGLSSTTGSSGLRDPIDDIDVKKSLVDRLFGGTEVEIKPQGNIDLTFGFDYQKVANPLLTQRQQRNGGFDFDMDIQMNVTGKIGEKLNLSTNYNTGATFGTENLMKLDYNSDSFSEDEIMKKIEAGNVSLPLKGTLIQGSQNLFGLKTELQFGRLFITAVASQQRSRQQSIQIQGGAQVQEFEVGADEYDEDRHFFLTHYNRDNFEQALENLPQINSLFRIIDIDVYITNTRNRTEDAIDIVAMSDLGEPQVFNNPSIIPANPPRNRDVFGNQALPGRLIDSTSTANLSANDLLFDITNYNNGEAYLAEKSVRVLQNVFNLQPGRDFKKVRAIKLNPNEYTYHPELGTISLNINLQPNDVLGVAFEYEYNQKRYQVGEMADDANFDPENSSVRFVKMLKSSAQRVDLPIWDLMMKNIYSVGAFQVNPEDFLLDIYYEDPGNGFKRFLPETNIAGKPLMRVFNLDRINVQGDPCPDGIFDFIPGITINPRNGRIMFPVLEPFGSDLVEDITEPEFKAKYEFRQLYDSTLTRAREYPELNRFVIKGTYKSSISSEISLGAFNLPEGSVRVSGGGRPLIEGQDYEVDYNIGRVRVLDESLLNSGNPINVSFEDNTLFGFQSKTMLGLRADYKVNKNFELGATYLHLFERPFTRKVNIGDDPISNRMYGIDVNFTKDAPWLTKFVDAIPLIQTKEPSTITFAAEAAVLKPGHAKAINTVDSTGSKQKGGTVYIDDFEGTTSGYDLRNAITNWVLASVPQNDERNGNPLFPESRFIDTVLTGVNRARLNWYRIDEFVRPANSENDPYIDRIQQTEIFPTKAQQFNNINSVIPTLDLTLYPDERGPYNFDLPGAGTDYSAGLANNGQLNAPETRWGGIMRDLPNTNFEAANIEYIDFWVLNPFMNGDNPGDLYLNLGNISEDILRDSRRFYENGIPTGDSNAATDTTTWGRIPRGQSNVTNAFSNDPDAREIQDVGLDGLDDSGEREVFAEILTQYQSGLSQGAYNAIQNDPSNDNFVYFNSRDSFPTTPTTPEEVFRRYKRNNDPQGNSALSSQGNTNASTNLPDSEDINRDNSLNEEEEYFQYHIPLRSKLGPDGYELEMDPDLVTDSIHQVDAPAGVRKRIWYRFKIPIDQYTSRVGGIQDFRSIQFMRMYLKNFRNQVTLRFATLELTRNQWRRYFRPLIGVSNGGIGGPVQDTRFEVNAVGLDENSSRTPFPYTLPPGLRRERQTSASFAVDAFQDERSLSMVIEDLGVDSLKGIYKILNLDMRFFDSLEMFIHAERIQAKDRNVENEDLALFVRMGSDFENNFYEYEIPLTFSDSAEAALLQGQTEPLAREIWRQENFMKFSLKKFIELKKARNRDNFPLNDFYSKTDTVSIGGIRQVRDMRIKGNPNLGLVKGMMIGVVNRDYTRRAAHSAEIWVNELRVSGLDETGGAAALARLDMQLADFGNLTLATNYSTRGWGGIEEKLADRSREDIFQYDASLSLELGKLLPEESGVVIPMYASVSETFSTPQFDPYDLDIPLKEKLDETQNKAARDSIRKQAQDYSSIKSLNFTNVRKNRSGNRDSKPMPWDISNFKLTYAYTEMNKRNPIIESDKLKTYHGALDYNYSMTPLYISPFKKLIKKDKHLKLISELNFNLIPNSFSVSNIIDRDLQKTKYRFTDLADEFSTFYNKRFTWDRNYTLNWDLTKSLKFNFSANNRAIIDELKAFDGDRLRDPSELKEEIWTNLKDFGRTKNYQHTAGASYTVPFKKIPYMDWITVKASYNTSYNWAGSAIGFEGQPGIADTLGNVVSNTQNRAINGNLNFESFYRKFKYLEKIDKPRRKKGKRGRGGDEGDKKTDRSNRNSTDKGGSNKSGGGSKGGDKGGSKGSDKGSDKSSPIVKGNDKGGSKGKSGGKGNSAPNGKGKGKDGKKGNNKDGKGTDPKKKKKKKPEREPTVAERIIVRPLLMIRRLSVDFTEDFGTIVPGYLPRTELLGQSNNFTAPGWDFIAGIQPDIRIGSTDDWLQQSAAKGWLSSSVMQNQEVSQRYSQQFKASLKLEPFKDFRIDINADRRYEENLLLNFKDPTPDGITSFTHGEFPQEISSFSISYFTANTLFNNDVEALFEEFSSNRPIISNRLGDLAGGGAHESDPGYAEGFGRAQSAVLIPAFLAAYTGQDPNTIEIDEDFSVPLFNTLPKINWKLTYNGLSKLPGLKDIFQNVKLSHGYKSSLRANAIDNNTSFFEGQRILDNNDSYYSRLNLPDLVISEQFSPLIGLSVRTKSGMDINVDFKKSRNLSFSSVAFVLTETKSTEYVAGFNYTMKDVYLSFFYGKNAKKKKRPAGLKRNNKKNGPTDPDKKGKKEKGHDMNFKFDFSFRDDITLNHTLDGERDAEATRGLKSLTISPSIDYDINKQLNVRLFYDYRRTNPANSLSFPMTNTQAGVTIRFSLN